MSRAILNFAKGAWYPAGQARLAASLDANGAGIDRRFYDDEAQLGCGDHRVAPYAFKVAAFQGAVRAEYRTALWCDAAVWAIKPVTTIFDAIEDEGYVLFESGWNCGQWTNDRMLAHFGISRDEAEKMPMLMACCMGLDLRTDLAAEFLRLWEETVPFFLGGWDNATKAESLDPRCLGHRHDQSAASIIAYRLGMHLTVGHVTHFQYYYYKPEEIGYTVCLLSQGM